MKTAFALFAVLFIFTSTFALRTPSLRGDRDTLQQVFNGFWEQASLADPQTAVSCFDDNSATQAVNALGNTLSELANNNVAGAEKTVTDFVKTLPQPVKDCLGANDEVQNMLSAYKIKGLTPSQVESKLVKFLVTHIFSLHKDAVQANSNFQSGNYKPVGTEGGVIAQQVFGSGRKSSSFSTLKDAKSTLQLLNNGFYEQAGLPDPVTVLNCYDDDTAELTVDFIGTVLQQMADNNVVAVEKTIKAFQAQAPQSLKDCLNSNAEIQTVQRAYGFYGMTLDQIQNKIEVYAFSHLIAFRKAATQANNDFKAGNFVTVGSEGGQLAKQIFQQSLRMRKNLRSDRDTLQLVFNGFWEQAGLADPQTAVSCFDDNSATQAVNALGNSLSQLANNNVAGAEKTITDFVNALPQSVKTCLGANSEVQSMLSAYHIAGLTPSQVESKLVKFLVTHIFSLHKDAVQANSNFQSGNYKPVGTEGGVIAQQVFGSGRKSSSFSTLKDAQSTLQDLYNGYFEQANLPDPTTILSCYDDDTTQLTVNFIGSVLVQMANNMVIAVEKTIKAYQSQVPQAVKDCLAANAELQEVEKTYGYAGLTLILIQARVEAYAINHLQAFHAASVQANNDFRFGNFKTVGKEGGQLAQQVFANKNTRKSLRSDRDTLQLVFNGFWEQAGLADPQTAVSCFDDNSATQAVNALGNSLSQLANNNVAGAEKTITDFVNTLPQPVKTCLGANSEVQSMLSAYHIAGLTPSQVESKLVKFLVTHIFSLHKDAVQANSNFQSGNYKPVGTEGGVIAQQVFGNGGKKLGSDADTLQGIFTGAFNQVGLTVPTTVISCFDSNTLPLTNSALGTILDQVSYADFVNAGNTMRNYFNVLPSSVTDCLQQNGEYIQFLRKYHLATITIAQFQAKVAEFALLHRQQLVTLDNIANQYWINAKFASAGQEIGVILQQIFGSSSLRDQDPKDTLQQYLNGYFEYAKLEDPTTIISSCFNDDTATLVVNLIANLVDELANNKVLVAEKTALDFIKTCPPALKACVFSNPEAVEVIKAYGLNTYTPPTAVAKVVAYALTHASQFTGTMVSADQAIQLQEYASAGQVFGQVTQMVFGKSAERYFRGRF